MDIAEGQGKKHVVAQMTTIKYLMYDNYYYVNIMYEYYLLLSIDN